jgi:hypothetical protein
VVSQGEEVDDDVPRNERNSMVTTAASIFSRGGSRGRLEMRGATMRSSGSCVIDSLRGNGWEKDHQVRRSKVKEGEVEEGTRAHRWPSISMETRRQYCSSDERLRGPSGAIGRGKKGKEERRLRPSYTRGRGID